MFGQITFDNLEYFVQGYLTTILLSVGAMAAAFVIGSVPRRCACGAGASPSRSPASTSSSSRNTPLLIQLFFFAVVLAPNNLGITADPFVVALFGLSIYTGAFATEAIRSGILAIDPGQVEAARSLGSASSRRSGSSCCRRPFARSFRPGQRRVRAHPQLVGGLCDRHASCCSWASSSRTGRSASSH